MARKRSILCDQVYKNANEHPEKEAILCDRISMTYKEFCEYVAQFSNLMIANGIDYGDKIAMPMNNTIESVGIFFAAADLGACIVPLNPSLPTDAVKASIKASDTKHIFARQSFYRQFNRLSDLNVDGVKICLDNEYPGTINFSSINEMSSIRPNPTKDIIGDESLILTMTSGSTGNPKPIDISQKNKYDRAIEHIKIYNLTCKDRILAATPLYHSLAERLIIMPLILGATAILLPRFTPEIWLECVNESHPTFTIAVSAQLAQIIESLKISSKKVTSSFRCIVSSSALLEVNIKKELIDILDCDFHEIYGTSETSTITDICFGKVLNKINSVGKPIECADVRILREDETDFDTDCNYNEIGEIICKSNLQCKGYYNQKKMMVASTFEGYFRTGDLGYFDEDGYLYFVGRKKEIIITGAINVYPNDIDSVLRQLPSIEDCAAFSYPDEQLGEVVAVAVVPKKNCIVKSREIRLFCAKRLADFQQPHKIFIVKELPKNTMGKLKRSALYDYIKSLDM